MQKKHFYPKKKSEPRDIKYEKVLKDPPKSNYGTHNENKVFLVYFYLPQISVSIRI